LSSSSRYRWPCGRRLVSISFSARAAPLSRIPSALRSPIPRPAEGEDHHHQAAELRGHRLLLRNEEEPDQHPAQAGLHEGARAFDVCLFLRKSAEAAASRPPPRRSRVRMGSLDAPERERTLEMRRWPGKDWHVREEGGGDDDEVALTPSIPPPPLPSPRARAVRPHRQAARPLHRGEDGEGPRRPPRRQVRAGGRGEGPPPSSLGALGLRAAELNKNDRARL
jgi:hypothetical protein